MSTARHHERSAHHSGGVLLEVLLSIALFVGAGAFALGAANSVHDALHGSLRRQQALDMARSTLARLEVGLITTSDVRSGGALQPFDALPSDPSAIATWDVELDTQPSDVRGWSLVTITVRRRSDGADSPRDAGPLVELRQLMELREQDELEYEPDEMLRGLDERIQ